MKGDEYAKDVADSIIEALQNNTAPWVKPWTAKELVAQTPYNPITNNSYNGINAVNLLVVGTKNMYNDPRWLTYKQAKDIGAQVRSGEKGTTIQYWKFKETIEQVDEEGNKVLDEKGNPVKMEIPLERPSVFYATVFNASQIDNMPELDIAAIQERKHFEPIETAENILKNSGANIIFQPNGISAHYRPDIDQITLPEREQFKSESLFYGTALHELGHWTGHETRLNRNIINPFGSESYAKEELRAEIASFMLCSEIGLDFDPTNHVAYVGSWIKALENDPKEIFRAATDATKILNYVVGLNQEKELKNEQDLTKEEKTMPSQNHSDLSVTDSKEVSSSKTFINVPYSEKDEAKKLGAKWDKDQKTWYIEAGADLEKFSKWIEKSEPVELKNNTLVFDETNLAAKVSKSEYNLHRIPLDVVEDAISKFGTIRLDDYGVKEDANENKKIIQTYAELVVDGKKYILNTNPNYAVISPREKWNDTLFEDISHSGSVITNLAKLSLEQDVGTINIADTNKKEPTQEKPSQEKTLLYVPYSEKDEAKKLGAKWDKDQKTWYADNGADLEKLSKWTLPAPVKLEQTYAEDPRIEFANALADRGLILDDLPVMDGKIQRVQVEGDKGKKKSGAYIGHLDGRPAGFIQNFREGIEERWKSSAFNEEYSQSNSLSPAQLAERKKELERIAEERNREKEAQYLKVSSSVADFWESAKIANNEHPYLKDKGVSSHGLKLDERGNLLMPLHDVNGKIWSAQHIGINGYKSLETGGKKEGNFFVIGSESSMLAAKEIIVCEGYATGASIHAATKRDVVVAVDAGNLYKVAVALHEKYPDKEIVIAADNDIAKELQGKDNVGRMKAEIAAEAVNGKVILPMLTSGEAFEGKSDFNDIHKSRGLEEVEKQFNIFLNANLDNKKDVPQKHMEKAHSNSLEMAR